MNVKLIGFDLPVVLSQLVISQLQDSLVKDLSLSPCQQLTALTELWENTIFWLYSFFF